ncbi:hypothetical protein BH11MYX1_BH11MYX1_02590 [soil metagenome]
MEQRQRARRAAPRVELLAVLAVVAACKANQPSLTDAHGALDARCAGPNADLLFDYFPTTIATPTAALGAPDGAVVTLAANSEVTVGFIGLGGLTDGAGVDLRIIATLDPGASALVRVAQTDQVFSYAGTLDSAHHEFDLGVAMVTTAVYVRLIDAQGAIGVDAFEAVHDQCR